MRRCVIACAASSTDCSVRSATHHRERRLGQAAQCGCAKYRAGEVWRADRAAGGTGIRSSVAAGRLRMSAKPVCIAQISDLHIKRPGELAYGRVDTAEALE